MIFLKKWKTFPALFMKKSKSYENHEISKNFMISDMSKHEVFPRKYLTLLRYPALFWGILPIFCSKSCIYAHFGVLEPKSALLGPKWDFGAPGAKPFINTTFWELFWRPWGGKTDFGGQKPKSCKISWKCAENSILGQKVRKLQNRGKPPKTLPFLL